MNMPAGSGGIGPFQVIGKLFSFVFVRAPWLILTSKVLFTGVLSILLAGFLIVDATSQSIAQGTPRPVLDLFGRIFFANDLNLRDYTQAFLEASSTRASVSAFINLFGAVWFFILWFRILMFVLHFIFGESISLYVKFPIIVFLMGVAQMLYAAVTMQGALVIPFSGLWFFAIHIPNVLDKLHVTSFIKALAARVGG